MSRSTQSSPLRAALQLTAVILAGWAACAWPAWSFRGVTGLQWMSIAAICCLIPGWIVVFLPRLAIFSNDLQTMLVQTTIRMTSVAAVAIVVRSLRPELGLADFYGWLIGFYLLALACELWVLLGPRRTASDD